MHFRHIRENNALALIIKNAVKKEAKSLENLKKDNSTLGKPGSDLLFRVLRRSTISAEAFNDRVRDGIGFDRLAITTGPAKDKIIMN